jgi:hypothetical protein
VDFPYHRGLAPMMWMFVILAAAELAIVHFLVSLWNITAALVLSGLTLASIAWMVALIRSFRRLPVRIGDGRLVLRAGFMTRLETPLDNVAGVHTHWDGAALKAPNLLNLALLAYPNVIVDFVQPIPRGRKLIRAVAHRFDDPAAFIRALSGISGGHDRP